MLSVWHSLKAPDAVDAMRKPIATVVLRTLHEYHHFFIHNFLDCNLSETLLLYTFTMQTACGSRFTGGLVSE